MATSIYTKTNETMQDLHPEDEYLENMLKTLQQTQEDLKTLNIDVKKVDL